MAALIRCARFCSPSLQIPKLLRIASCGTSQVTAEHIFKETHRFDHRSWCSTVAEGMSGEAMMPTATKLETMMNSLDRYVRQFGRVSKKQLDPVVSCLDTEGSISVSHSLSLLRLYGSTLYDEPPASRLKLADELWEKYKKHGVPLEVMHYNTLLAVYNTNKLQFSPTEFLANMESNGVAPNRITYQRLIARFCEIGDIQGATQVLEHMKSSSMPINDHVFNSFITGHLRCNDPDSARSIVDVMRQTGLEPANTTYTVLAMGFAEKGDMEEVKKYLSQAEVENAPLRPGQLLDVYTVLAVNGHEDQLSELFPFLHAGPHFRQDGIRACNELIAEGYDAAAYKLFLEMPRPSRMEPDQITLGRFFLRALARHQRPVDKVAEVVKDMQMREVNKDDLSAIAHLAYLEGQPAYALTVLEKMKNEGMELRAHYFWPSLCQFKDAANKEGLYEVMGQMKTLQFSGEDMMQTLFMYTIPALLDFGEAQSDIISNLQNHGLETGDVQFAVFLSLLYTSRLEEALQFLESHEVSANMLLVRSCMLNMPTKGLDWKSVIQILGKLKALDTMWRRPALDMTALALRRFLADQRRQHWADTKEVFDLMAQQDMKIMRRHQAEMAEYFAGAPAEVLERLKEMVSTERQTFPASERQPQTFISRNLSLEQLQQMSEDQPDNKAVQKQLLIKACVVGNVEEAERVYQHLEREGFVLPPLMLSYLTHLYATVVKDLDKATAYLQQLEERFPEFRDDQNVVLKVAALQVTAGDTEGAMNRIKSYADRHSMEEATELFQRMRRLEMCANVVTCATDIDSARQLMMTLTQCGYATENNVVLLGSFMKKVVESGDSELILKEFEDMVKTHKRSPEVDTVLQFFIHKEDADSVQKVVDLTTELHGLSNVLHHLIADFIACGHMKKARKILETPGLRANMQRLSRHCQEFIEQDKMKELEMLVELTKEMFAVDRDVMLFHLIRGYVKQKSLDQAKDVLLQYEEEMIQPSVRTLRFLARSLQSAGLPVPFDVPDFVPLRETTAPARKGDDSGEASVTWKEVKTGAGTERAGQLREALEKGDMDTVMTHIKGDANLMNSAIGQLKKPWPVEKLTALFEWLSQQGDVDTLDSINRVRLPVMLKRAHREHILIAAVNCGRGQEMIDRLASSSEKGALYLTFSALDRMKTSAPQLMDNVESAAHRLFKEKDDIIPLSVLWSYHRYNDSSRAEDIRKEVPDFDKKVIVGSLCYAAVKDNKVDVLESLLEMKRGEEQGTAVVYSSLLQLYAGQGDVEGVQKTCDRLVSEGVSKSSLRVPSVRAVESFLTDNSQPLPAWGDDSSSDSSSSSSSDEEKPLQQQS